MKKTGTTECLPPLLQYVDGDPYRYSLHALAPHGIFWPDYALVRPGQKLFTRMPAQATSEMPMMA